MAFPDNHQSMIMRISDYGAERSTVTMRGAILTAANFDAQAAAALSLRDAIADITIGLLTGFDFGNRYEIVSPKTQASDPFAQREAKWRVRFMGSDASGPHRLEIPCPDLQFLDVNNRGFLDLTSTEGAAFVSAFEAWYVLEGGATVTVLSVEHIGKNL